MSPRYPGVPPAKGGYFPLVPPQSITPLSAKLIGGRMRVTVFRLFGFLRSSNPKKELRACWLLGIEAGRP